MKVGDVFKGFKERLGSNGPGLTVAVVALIVALTGGAFAAGGALTNSQKKQVTAIAQKEAKKFPGPAGPAGSQGPAGPAGSKGDAGAQGSEGKKGADGKNGVDGKEGEGIVLTSIAEGDTFACDERGGVNVRLKKQTEEEGQEVCSGKEGDKGEKGEPWAPDSTLPDGATEAGAWAFSGTESDTEVRVPISFSIRNKVNLTEEHVHFGFPEEGGAFSATGACPSESAFNPQAKKGELCVYANEIGGVVNADFEGIFVYSGEFLGATKSGAFLSFVPTGAAFGAGSFAVTGCTVDPSETTACLY